MTEAFKCPRCGTTTWGNLEYCSNCGEPLTIECLECGYKWRYIYKYKYCPSCGAKTSRSSLNSASKEG